GLPPYAPPDELRVLEGRRFLVADADRAQRRAYVEAGLAVGAEVEWMSQARPPLERVAAWALPVGAVILAAGRGRRMGRHKLVLLGDQPLVDAGTIALLLRHWRREGSRVAVATRHASDDGHGPWLRPPVLLDRSLFAELRTLTGDEGARQVLNRRRELVDVIV